MMAHHTPMKLNLNQALLWLSHAQGVGLTSVLADRVHTDSRSLQSGDLFVALRGERFDGHQFIGQAKAQGAVGVVCEPSGQDLAIHHGLPALIVPDARIALGELAQGWRSQFTLPLIAVTGSNGKTTVTRLTGLLLERAGIVTLEQLKSARRYAIVGAFAIAAVLTPPILLRLRL